LALERIVFFSDAVIAIAITLLAIEIRLPAPGHDVGGAALRAALGALWPRYLSFVVSFLVIGSYWWVHHRAFRAVRRYDEPLIWLNLAFLLCVAFLPFASSVLGEHGNEPTAATFYALCVAATGLMEVALWAYVSRGHRLIDAEVPARSIRLATLRAATPPVVFLLSLPLVWVNPSVAMVCWLGTFPITATLRRAEGTA
jgi:uncharacterized membrane protein